MKKALSLVVALLMLMSLCITPVMAAEPDGSVENPYYVANPMRAPGLITIPANSAVYYQYNAAVFNGWEVGGYGLSAIIVDGVVYDELDMWGEVYATLDFTFVSPGIVGYVNDTAEDIEVSISHNQPLGSEDNPDVLVEGENSFFIPTNLTSYTAVYLPRANGEYTFSTAQAEDFMIYVDVDEESYLIEDGSLTLALESYLPVMVTILPVGLTGDVTLTVTAPAMGTEENPIWLDSFTVEDSYVMGNAIYFSVDGSLSGSTLNIAAEWDHDLTVIVDGVEYVAEGGKLSLPLVLGASEWYIDLAIFQEQDVENTLTFSIEYAEGTYENPIELVLGDNAVSVPDGVDGYYYSYTVEADGLLIVTPAAVDAIGYLGMYDDVFENSAYLQDGASSMMMPVTAGEVIGIQCSGLMDEETFVSYGVETVLNLATKDLALYSDFESVELEGWSSTSNLTLEEEEVVSGWYSAKFEVTKDWGNIYAYAHVEPNTDYEVSFKLKANLGNSLWVKFNKDWAYDLSQATVQSSTEWADYTVTLNSGEADSVVVLFQYAGYGADGEIFWLDDIVITKAEAKEPVPGDNLIVNGSFEDGSYGWETWQSTEICNEAAKQGSLGAHLQGNGGWGGLLNQTVAVQAGKVYKLSFFIHVATVGVNVQVKDGAGKAIEGAGGWFDTKTQNHTVEWTFTATDDKVLINFCGSGTNNPEDVHVDDFVLTEIVVKEPSFDGYIYNGDFETGDLSNWENLWGSCDVSFVEGYESDNAVSIVAGGWNQVRQDGIAVEPNTDYVLTAQVKNVTNFGVIVKKGDDSGDINSYYIEAIDDWSQIALSFNSGDQSEICVLLIGWDGGGSAIIDNVSIAIDEGGDDPVVPPVAAEGIVNGDFETGDAEGWETWQETSISADAAHTGSYGAHLVGNGGWGGLLNQTVTVIPGQQYKLSFWINVNAAGVNVQVKDGTGAAIEGVGGWFDANKKDCLVEWTFVATDESVFINFCGGGTGVAEDVYVDSFVLTEVKAPTGDGYITNGDFETGDAIGWETWQSTTVSADAAYSGSYGAHLVGNGGWGGLLNQSFSAEVGKTYAITLWVKVNASGANLQIKGAEKIEGACDNTYLSSSELDGWTQRTFNVIATESVVTLNFCGGGTNVAEDIYVDDIVVAESEIVVKEPSFDGYIYDGDFEMGDLSNWNNLWDSCDVSFVDGYESNTAISIVGGSWSQVRQNGIAVEKNKNYVLTAWVKNAENFGIVVKDGDDTTDIDNYYIERIGDWQQITLEFNSGDYEEICVLMIAWDGGGSAILDNVSIAEGADPTPDYKPGDVNGDGRINNRDLGMLQQYLADWDPANMNGLAADVNGDGRINNRDLGILQQYLADWDVELKHGKE